MDFEFFTGHALLNTDQHRKLKLGTKMRVNNLSKVSGVVNNISISMHI